MHWMKMDALLEHFPQGLDTVIGVEGTNLSGGERQNLKQRTFSTAIFSYNGYAFSFLYG